MSDLGVVVIKEYRYLSTEKKKAKVFDIGQRRKNRCHSSNTNIPMTGVSGHAKYGN